MSNNYLSTAIGFTALPAEARLIQEAFSVANDLNDEPEAWASIEMSPEFLTAFPTQDSFLELFNDREFPSFDAMIDVEEDGGVYIAGTQIDPNAVGELIRLAAPSILPFGFSYAYYGDKLRVGEFGGGYIFITADEVEAKSTDWIIRGKLEALRS